MLIFRAGVALLFSLAGLQVKSAVPDLSSATVSWPGAPPQDTGLPYTRSARPQALERIRPYIALFAGSRYAYVYGHRVRLDDAPAQMLHAAAILQDGKLMVPTSFAGLIGKDDPQFDEPVTDVAFKWVYTVGRPAIAGIPTVSLDGENYVDAAEVAQQANLPCRLLDRGLMLIGKDAQGFTPPDAGHYDAIITLFDTPDQLADPDIATQYIPRLKLQGKWTDHVKVTPEQLKLLDGPPTKFTTPDPATFDLDGFNQGLLGSAVPPPGVYPRLLFSEADLPTLRDRMKANKLGQQAMIEWDVLFHKTWWDNATSDGQIFLKLATGKTADLHFPDPAAGTPQFEAPDGIFKDQKPDIFVTHVNYITNTLTSMALYCLLTGDDAHGAQAASAIVNYYKLIEPRVDELNRWSDSEFGTSNDNANFAETAWRGMHGVVAHMDLGLSLDFAGKWMSDEQKLFMRRFIAKATYGRRDNMQAAVDRVKDINHMTWHLTSFIAASAIEGLPECDPEVLEAGRESCRAFLDWGIDDFGQIFESNGKNGGGMQFQLLSMIILARRGDNLWGHPHWRKLLESQVQVTSPAGTATVSSGTWGASSFSTYAVDEIKAFYPGNRAADWLLGHGKGLDIDLDAYRAQLEKKLGRTRVPGPSYPSLTYTGIYNTDWQPTTLADLNLPITHNDTTYGMMSARSDRTPDAAWLCLHVRANQYIGSGHHHADVGMFYMSSDAIDWITESPFVNTYDGKYYSEVLIDGIAEPDGLPAVGTYLGASESPLASFGTVDQTHPYSYKWINQIILWKPTGDNVWDHNVKAGSDFELETDPLPISVYKGTQHYKSRPWWPTYNFSNWMPVVRTPFNTVQYAFRTAGLIRGKHSYGLVIDDVKKDESSHLYQWTAMLGANVFQADVPALPAHSIALAASPTAAIPTHPIQPAEGAPLLLVVPIDLIGRSVDMKAEHLADGPADRKGKPGEYDRVSYGGSLTEAHFRTLLIPIKAGQLIPRINIQSGGAKVEVTWPDQEDVLSFSNTGKSRAQVTLMRSGESPVTSK
jgi:hypothetical protein